MDLFKHHSCKETGRRAKTVLTCLFSIGLMYTPAVHAQSKSFVSKTPQELDQREAELLRKEAAVIKQLSASASGNEAGSTRASLSPAINQQANANVPARAVVAPGNFEQKAALDAPSPVAPSPDMTQVIADKDQQIETLTQEVSKLRNRLMLAETEVERLSSVIDERNRRQISSLAGQPGPSNPYLKKAAPPQPPTTSIRNPVPAPSAPEQQDMQVVTVRADKAYLRTGPGDQNSPLMTVSQGTRLAVETRSGDWYRVISPAGTRAWVSAKVVVFGNLDPSRATRISGFAETE